ncbi:MAG: DUF4139 domain-containing protein [Crocinitomicaceae bacterium]|nr:DUF4139 domain-containing protein [Crocinitomicaceae bacterium]
MKSTLIIITTLFISNLTLAADTLSTDINKATVFLSGAQVFRESKTISIKKGVNEIIIKDVSPFLNQSHVQATASGNFLILDVQYQTEYVAPSTNPPVIIPAKIQKEINWLNDTLLFISFEKERIQFKLNNLNEEKRMVTQNQLIKSGGISDTLPEFKNVVEFYRVKLDEINELIHSWKKKQHYTNVREVKFRTRLNELNKYSGNIGQPTRPAKTRHHILVTTYSEAATSGKIEVNYLVPNAGWIPAYDLRADNTVDPMSITYKANVYQNSGEDWKNVHLTLSTYNQNCFTTKPTTGIWRLDYTVFVNNEIQISAETQMFQNQNTVSQVFDSQAKLKEAQSGYRKDALGNNQNINFNQQFISMQSMANISQNFSNVEFDIRLPYSIKADGSQKLMVVTSKKVNADFSHYMLPRANKNAFLLARIGDWESLSLLPGKANIYFNQTIVGSTQIDPSILTDTMEVTLGRDQGIVSTRKKIGETQEKKNLGKNILKSYTFEIRVKNSSKGEINLTLEDQIPITPNEDIIIKLVDGGGAKFNKATGKITWDLVIKAGDDKILQFSYSLEHDKDKPVS